MALVIKLLPVHPLAIVPEYMTEGAAGCDVSACIDQTITLQPLERVAVPTGLKMQIPDGFEIQVRPRSGLALKKGLTVVNAPGTIDCDFRGEVKILLVNLSPEPVIIEHGDRIAQFILAKVERLHWNIVSELSATLRAEGGFGSTDFQEPPPENSSTH